MVDLFESFNGLHNRQKVMMFVVGFSAVYFYAQGAKQAMSGFFLVILAVSYYIINMHASNGQRQELEVIQEYIDALEKTIQGHASQAMVLEHVYKIHKPLKSIAFIKGNSEVREILYELRFMNTYDKETYIDFVICFEYFLKVHYNVMIGKYDAASNFSVLRDIKHELLNTLQSVHFKIPNISQVFDSSNLDKDLKRAIFRVQALTFRYMRVLYNKFRNKLMHENYHGYYGVDTGKNDHYHIY